MRRQVHPSEGQAQSGQPFRGSLLRVHLKFGLGRDTGYEATFPSCLAGTSWHSHTHAHAHAHAHWDFLPLSYPGTDRVSRHKTAIVADPSVFAVGLGQSSRP